MPKGRVNSRLIKLHRSYAVEEAAQVLGVHKNTVRNWIAEGLPVLASMRPALILGTDLRTFLDRRRKQLKRPCPPGTLFCLKCRTPSRPALDMVEFVPHSPTGGNLKALCETCGTMMHQRIARAAITLKMPGIDVQLTGAAPSIEGSALPPLNCDK